MEKVNLKDRTTYYASSDLLDQLSEKITEGDTVINFAYTDYGGTFYDKAVIEYLKVDFPESIIYEETSWYGQNAFIWGEFADRFLAETENYCLDFEGLEEFYMEWEYEETKKGVDYFIESLDDNYSLVDSAEEKIMELVSDYYSVLTSGLDYSESELIERCIQKGIITEKQEAE